MTDQGKSKVDESPTAPKIAKPAGATKPTEAPKGVDAAKEVAKTDNIEARRDLGDEPAQDATKPSETGEESLDKPVFTSSNKLPYSADDVMPVSKNSRSSSLMPHL